MAKGKKVAAAGARDDRQLLVRVPVATYRKLVAEVRKREDVWEAAGREGERPTLSALVEERCR